MQNHLLTKLFVWLYSGVRIPIAVAVCLSSLSKSASRECHQTKGLSNASAKTEREIGTGMQRMN